MAIITGEANIASNNKINSIESDIFGIGKAITAYFEYRKFKISIQESNIESLYHLIKKAQLSQSKKVKDFIDKIFKLYEKDSNMSLSMPALKILEYLDDDLLDAIEVFREKVEQKTADGCGSVYLIVPNPTEKEMRKLYCLRRHGVAREELSFGAGVYKISEALVEIMKIEL